VVAAPDETWGEVPVAFVTLTGGGAAIDEADCRAFLRQRLARFKVPRDIHVVGELPKTGTGKIQKFALREIVAKEKA
jgi:fatty-acyl-CoA synthase